MSLGAAFYLYILPVSISAFVLVWMGREKWKERRKPHLHPGE